MRPRILVLLLFAALLTPAVRAADDADYRTPPSVVADLLTAPRAQHVARRHVARGLGPALADPDQRARRAGAEARRARGAARHVGEPHRAQERRRRTHVLQG